MSVSKQTIFLTQEENDRMRKTLKGKLQKCQELKGQPREPGDPKRRLNQVTMASLLSDFAATPGKKSQRDTIVAFPVGNQYLPSTVSLQDLNPLKLSDLKMETHHRGFVLTVKRVADVVKLTAYSWTVVQEERSEETERLEIWLHKSKHGRDVLESAEVFQIKEPYFTLSDEGEPTLRIDHPSDLVVCEDGLLSDKAGDSESAGPTVAAPKTAKEYKEEGNAALKQKDLMRAHDKYTQGLKILTKDGAVKEALAYDVFRNRAHVNLLLSRLDEAKTDGLAAVTGLEDPKYRELDGKAYMRAASAAYNLGEFEEAKDLFQKQEKLMPESKDATARRRKAELRLKEQDTGVYDFQKIRAGISAGRPQVDAANFIRNVKVAESPGQGRGLFATRDIKPGEIVLCEKSFCAVWGHENEAFSAMTYDDRDDRIRVFPAGLSKAIVQKLLDNPSLVERAMDLCGDYDGIGKQLIISDSVPVVDTFQVHDIVTRNAFGLSSVSSAKEDVGNASTGLWMTNSYINHSCVPNATKEAIGDLMLLRATQKIRAGDQVTHSYDFSSDYDARNAALMNTWGFTCMCALCVVEKEDDPASREKRRGLEDEARNFVERFEAVGARMLSVVKAKRFLKSINDTYDEQRYKGLPRLALVGIQKWLAEAT